MKKLKLGIAGFLVCLLGFVAWGITSHSSGFYTYSHGYRYGKLVNCETTFYMSVECRILLGDGSDVISVDNDGDKFQINPWFFSASIFEHSRVSELNGKMVWVEYTESMFKWPFRDTNYYPVEIGEITDAPACQVHGDGGGLKRSGEIVGQIVKASKSGVLINTWEVIIHEGGKKFKAMSIEDDTVGKCAQEWVKAGVDAKITYNEKITNMVSFEDTGYRINGISAP